LIYILLAFTTHMVIKAEMSTTRKRNVVLCSMW